jgi:hypothetical protein
MRKPHSQAWADQELHEYVKGIPVADEVAALLLDSGVGQPSNGVGLRKALEEATDRLALEWSMTSENRKLMNVVWLSLSPPASNLSAGRATGHCVNNAAAASAAHDRRRQQLPRAKLAGALNSARDSVRGSVQLALCVGHDIPGVAGKLRAAAAVAG